MISHGYCPWCGAPILPYGFSPTYAEIHWDACRTRRCRGNNLDLVTDYGGWVLQPEEIKGRYINKPLDKPPKKRYNK